MTRAGATLAVFLALAAWAGAQGPAPAPGLTAADRVKLFKTNRALIRQLVTDGVELSNADEPDKHVEACRKTAHDLGVALQRAAEADDPDRVAELGDHLETMLRDGLVPAIEQARQTTPKGSPGEKRLRQICETAAGEVQQLIDRDIPMTGKVGESGPAQDVRTRLGRLQDRLTWR